MSNRKKPLIIGIVTLALLTGLLPFAYGKPGGDPASQPPAVPAAENASFEFKANSYTSPDQAAKPIAPRTIPDSYKLTAETETLQLYADPATLGFMIKNKRSGYVWGSIPSEEDIKTQQLNDEWLGNVSSPFLAQYFNEDAVATSGSFQSLGGKVVKFETTPNGFGADLHLEQLNADVRLEVSLDKDSLVVRIPDDGIKENGTTPLASIQPYPFLGTVVKDRIPGYMFIPDGSGALIRFAKDHPHYDEPFAGPVYGSDRAFGLMGPMQISMPVFGMVHGVGGNAFLGIIEDGKFNSEVVAYPSGINTDFYWVSSRFILRKAYFQPTSKSLGGINTYESERNKQDRQLRYLFLSGEDAGYSGMAKSYRGYLNAKGALPVQAKAGAADVPIRIEMLGAEMEPGLIGTHAVSMTTFEQARTIIDELRNQKVNRITAVYRGWNDGGLTGRNPDKFPVEGALGGNGGLVDLHNYLKQNAIPLYLHADYTYGYEKAGNFNSKVDAARAPSNTLLFDSISPWITSGKLWDIKKYYLSPTAAGKIAEKDAASFRKTEADGTAIEQTGSVLFSDYDSKGTVSRKQAADEYVKLAGTLKTGLPRMAVYQANDYMLGKADDIFDIPMTSSQYMYATDTVPFVQMVLHGIVDYYSPFSNFNANPQEQTLRAIEYGAYPSFMLTYEPSHKLKNTASNQLFTTYYKDWAPEVGSQYEKINQALRSVQDATMEQRTVPDWGIVQVRYSNGRTIVVNYRSEDVTVNGRQVKARDFAVIGGEGQ